MTKSETKMIVSYIHTDLHDILHHNHMWSWYLCQ